MKMKCVKSVLVGMTAVFTLVSTMNAASAAAASSDIQVILDGKRIAFVDAKPYADSSRVLVPLRVVSENLGAKVDYSNNVVTISQGSSVVKLTIGSKTASVNGNAVTLDSVTTVKSSRVFVPLRFVSEQLGQTVDWDSVDQYVWIGEKTVPISDDVVATEPLSKYRGLFTKTSYYAYGKKEYGTYSDFLLGDPALDEIQILSRDQLPLEIPSIGSDPDRNSVVYNIWIDTWNGQTVIKFHYSGAYSALALLMKDGTVRGRTGNDAMRIKHEDGTHTEVIRIIDETDDYVYHIPDWKAIKPEDVLYVMFLVDARKVTLMSNPFN